MTFTKSYETGDGVVHASSYWELSTIFIDKIKRQAIMTRMGRKDEASKATKNHIGVKVYRAEGAEFDTWFGLLEEGETNVCEQMRLYALDKGDFFSE